MQDYRNTEQLRQDFGQAARHFTRLVASASATAGELETAYARKEKARGAFVRAERAQRFAAKWRAEHERAEPPRAEEPTDAAFRRAFAGCVRPPKPGLYPLIREYIAGWQVAA